LVFGVCVFVQVYEERFERPYGFWRPYLQKVIYRYLECGDLHHGFARVKCRDCHHEYLLAYAEAKRKSRSGGTSAVISVPPAIRSGWWISGNGSVPTYFGRFPTGMSSSASRRSCEDTSSQLL